MYQRKNMKRAASFLLCLAVLLTGITMIAPHAAAKADIGDFSGGSDHGGGSGYSSGTKKNNKRIIVSLGDSYASGEGIEPFYGQDAEMSVKQYNEDWLAHRSENAWSGMLYLPSENGDILMKEHRNENWFFVASSGAVTDHIRTTGDIIDYKTGEREGQQQKDYDRDWVSGTHFLPGQLDIFYNTPGLDRFDVDYVTITIGGNDVDFAEIVADAALRSTKFDSTLYDKINQRLNDFYKPGSTHDKIKQAYKNIEEAAPYATILVAGYPELLYEKNIPIFFNEEECRFIDEAVRIFNSYIEALVIECRAEKMKIEFCPVLDEFYQHQAYAPDPYLNGIMLGTRSQDLKRWAAKSNYSMHPNYYGAKAYARCVQRKINELEEGKEREPDPIRETSEERDIVLVLDNSDSMYGTPIRETRKAAVNFIDTVLEEDASIGIVTFSDYAYKRTDFSKDSSYLKNVVQEITTENMTNTEGGLIIAEQMLDASTAKKKFIVLMSDGLPNEGKTGSELIEYAEQLREKGILIYTLGFFQSVEYWELGDAQNIMEEIASDACHFEVEDADDLVFFFEDIADQIRGTPYIYIRIACPVDVQVSYRGEVLSSTGNTRTSFGTVTFEEGENGRSYYGYQDDRTKILRLKEGADYTIEITGNGEGTMNYTVGFVDEEGKYTDVREITDIEVRESSYMESNAQRDQATVLKVDRDGDGRFDKTYSAGGPKKTEEPFPVWAWILIGVGSAALIAGAVVWIVLGRKRASGGKGPSDGEKPTSAPRLTRPETAGRFCPRCGKPTDGESRFCAGCGADLKPRTFEKPSGSLFSKPEPMKTETPTEPIAPKEPCRPSGSAKFCLHCGNPIEEGARFCLRCGQKL